MTIDRRDLLQRFAMGMLLTCTGRPATAAPNDLLVEKWENGTTFIALDIPDLPFVAFHTIFNVGLGDEGKHTGILSLLVRAWITESESRSFALLQSDMGAVGGAFGSMMSDLGDYVEINALCRRDLNSVAACAKTLFTDIIAAPRFSDAAVALARDDLRRARTLNRDSLFDDTLQTLRGRIWDKSPYSRTVFANEDDLLHIKAADVRNFYRRFFAPNRSVVVAIGSIPTTDASQIVRSSLNAGGWAQRDSAPPLPIIAPETVPTTLSIRPTVVARTAPAAITLVGFLAPGAANPADYAALLVLDAILGASKGGRIFRTLRDEKSLGYETRTILKAARPQSLLIGYISGTSDPATVAQEITRTMRSVLDDPPTESELQRAKRFRIGERAQDITRLTEQARRLAWSETVGPGAAFEQDFVAYIEAVTPDAVRKIAESTLATSAITVVTGLVS